MQNNLILLGILLLLPGLLKARIFKGEKEIEQYLRTVYERNSNLRCSRFKSALWNFKTNLNDTNKEELFKNISLIQAEGIRNEWVENFKNLSPKKNWSDIIKRQISIVKNIGLHALEPKDFKNLTNITKNITLTFKSVKICPFKKKICRKSEMLSLEPDLKNIMQQSRNIQELLYIWTNWRDSIGSDVKKQFLKYVELSNKAANLTGFKDTGQMWRSDYESPSFYNKIDELWDDVRPLYKELHKYVLKNMRTIYNSQLDFDDGLIPAHILGDMWAQDWSHLSNILKPYPKSYSLNITQELLDRKYFVIDMYRVANSFYTSMGLGSNEMSYDSYAMIEKPINRLVDCEAENYDFCNGRDYRMKACSNLTQSDFLEIHSQMAEIEYFQQYKNQPYTFRSAANPALSKAIGGAVGLAVSTPSYLSKVGLLNDYKNTHGSAINRLMDRALKDVASLPYNLLVDKWRWDSFNGGINDKWNRQWWKYREYYQKIKPPIQRDNDKFDPGAHIYLVDGLHSIDQFIATIVQFQIYKGLCIKSGQYDPKSKTPALNRCDFSRSQQAGNALRSSLQLGKSQHWKKILKELTNDDDFDASALLEYFEPLYDYLKNVNKFQKESTSTKKLPKKKKKKHNKGNRERSQWFQSTDFDEDSFEDDDEDFHDTIDSDVITSIDSINSWKTTQLSTSVSKPTTLKETLIDILTSVSSKDTTEITVTNSADYTKVNESTSISKPTTLKETLIDTLTSISSKDTTKITITNSADYTKVNENSTKSWTTENVTKPNLLNDFTGRTTKGVMEASTISSSTKNQTTVEVEARVTSSYERTTKNYSIDFVFRPNSSTVPSAQVETVTFPEVDRNKSYVENCAISRKNKLELVLIMLLLILYKLF